MKPDLVVYVNTPVNIACQRKKIYIETKNLYDTFYYNAGMDVTGKEYEESVYVYKKLLQIRYNKIFNKMNNVLELNETNSPKDAALIILQQINNALGF